MSENPGGANIIFLSVWAQTDLSKPGGGGLTLPPSQPTLVRRPCLEACAEHIYYEWWEKWHHAMNSKKKFVKLSLAGNSDKYTGAVTTIWKYNYERINSWLMTNFLVWFLLLICHISRSDRFDSHIFHYIFLEKVLNLFRWAFEIKVLLLNICWQCSVVHFHCLWFASSGNTSSKLHR